MIRLHSCLLTVLALFVIPGTRAATLLVANKSEATVFLFDLPAAQLRATVSVFDSRALDKLADIRLPDSSIPIGVLLSGDGQSLFVAHSNSHVITVYDAQSLERRATIPTGLEPDGMGWSPLDVAP